MKVEDILKSVIIERRNTGNETVKVRRGVREKQEENDDDNGNDIIINLKVLKF